MTPNLTLPTRPGVSKILGAELTPRSFWGPGTLDTISISSLVAAIVEKTLWRLYLGNRIWGKSIFNWILSYLGTEIAVIRCNEPRNEKSWKIDFLDTPPKVFSRQSLLPNWRYWSYLKSSGLRMTLEWAQRPKSWKPRASWFHQKTVFFAIFEIDQIWTQKISPRMRLRWSWGASDTSPELGGPFKYLHWHSETHWTRSRENWNFENFSIFQHFFNIWGRFS